MFKFYFIPAREIVCYEPEASIQLVWTKARIDPLKTLLHKQTETTVSNKNECITKFTTEKKEKADDEKRIKRKARFEIKLNIGASVGFILRQFFGVVFYCTEVELFVLIEASYNVDFALQFGKAWKRIFVRREFCNTFVLIRDSGLCLSVKKSLQRTNPSFRSNQLYKSFRLIADYFLSRNKIKFSHSFVSAQVFGLPSSTGPLGFPNKVCDTDKQSNNQIF